MRVLVTGGTGFIGSHLVERLAKEGLNVVVPVRKDSNREYLPHESVEIQNADLLDPQSVKSLLKGIDRVFHLASIRGSGWSFCDEKVYRVNVGMTKNLLEASVLEGVQQFVYISSVSVCGHPCGGPIDEDYPCSPKTRYGMTKYTSEILVRDFHKREKLPMTIVRPVITYGPRDAQGMVQKLSALINSKRYLTVGRGDNRVHLIYIDDLIEGLILAINSRFACGNTYILAGEEPVSINRLIRIVSSFLKKKVPNCHVPIWFASVIAYLMELSFRLFSIDREPFLTLDKIDIMCRDRFFGTKRAREHLGFRPKVSCEEGLEKAINWMKITESI